jgi:Protein of unknown function (DUF3102)
MSTAINASALATLMDAINTEHTCGRALGDAKKLFAHGEWLPWLEANTEISPRQCQKYMQLAEHWHELEGRIANAPAGAYLGINDALKLIAKPKDKPDEPRLRITEEDGKTRYATKGEMAEHNAWVEVNAHAWKETWLRCHPGRTPEEYDEVRSDDTSSPYWRWRKAIGEASYQAELAARRRDHPEMPEHQCQMSDEQYAEYEKWKETYEPPDISVTMDDDESEDISVIKPESVLNAYLIRAEEAGQMAVSCVALMRRFSESSKRLGKKQKEALAEAVRVSAETADAWAKLAQLMKQEHGEGDA